MKPIDGLSFQLYSARNLQPLEAQFELLAGLGYRRVEPFGGLLADPARLKAAMHKHQMLAPTCHVGFDRLRGDLLGALAACRDLGVHTVFAPAPLPDEREMPESGWAKLGRELRDLGRTVHAEGMKFGWHNHHWEYGKGPGGGTFLDAMFHEAPDLLWEADLAWIVRGGGDPVGELARYGARIAAVHVKDIAPQGEALNEDGWADPGHGVLDWKTLLAAMHAAGCKLFVVEHDLPSDVARFARRARETVAGWN